MSEIHWDQLGAIVGFTGFALHWVARLGGMARSRLARSLHFLSLAMMSFGGFGILMIVQGTGQYGEAVRQGLLLLALTLVAYFLWRAWRHLPRPPRSSDGL